MPKIHVVQPGECLTEIAVKYGFHRCDTIYEHPDNAPLREKRPNYNILYPGDEVVIPDKDVKTVQQGTSKRHRFRVMRPKKMLHLTILNRRGEPLRGEDYWLELPRRIVEGKTNGKGEIHEPIPAGVRSAKLSIGTRVYTLLIGGLDPLEKTGSKRTGLQQRLHNLGFSPGKIDGDVLAKTAHALAAFQAANGLPVTGEPDSDTLRELEKQHGS